MTLMSSSLVMRERPAFYRETAARMYHPGLFPVAQVVAEVPWVAGITTLAIISFYFTVGFLTAPARVLTFWLVLFLLSMTNVTLGIMLGLLAPDRSAMLLGVGIVQGLSV
jgi:ABC-type multidrug transport system permease subunit